MTLRDLYPDLNDEELKEAEEHLQRYLDVALRIYHRIHADLESASRPQALTVLRRNPTMEEKRSNAS